MGDGRLMAVSWFVYFEDAGNGGAVCEADKARMRECLLRTPELLRAHVCTPAVVGGPFRNDPPPPRLALQLDFASLPALEAAIGPHGALQALAASGDWPSLEGTDISHQAMMTRTFPVPGVARSMSTPAPRSCSYLVHYPGRAEDIHEWLRYYLTHHPRLLARLPGIRSIEIFTRLDWCDGLPWRRVHHMQRNRIVFDDASALTAALESAALQDLRADYRRFPRFEGGNVHHPMETESLLP